jgi:hypothetical protein
MSIKKLTGGFKVTMIAALLGGFVALGPTTGCASCEKNACGEKTECHKAEKGCPKDCKKPCCAKEAK